MRPRKVIDPTGESLRLQFWLFPEQVAMLDRLAVQIRLRHRKVISREAILRAIVTAAESGKWETALFGV